MNDDGFTPFVVGLLLGLLIGGFVAIHIADLNIRSHFSDPYCEEKTVGHQTVKRCYKVVLIKELND